MDGILTIKNKIMIKSIKNKYKYVETIEVRGKEYFRVAMKGIGKNSLPTLRDAAIAVDKILISRGQEPVNILIRK